MSGVGLIGALVIGILAGWIAEKVMSRNHGLLTNLIVGVIRLFRGRRYRHVPRLRLCGLPAEPRRIGGGAILFLFILDLVRGRSTANRRWS